MVKKRKRKLGSKVHCHICPLKDKCEWASPLESWRYQKSILGDYIYHEGRDEFVKDLDAVMQATQNCPLKKIVLETTTC